MEGLGPKLLLTPPATLGEPEKRTVTASRKILILQALSSSLNAGTAKRGSLSRGEAFYSPPAVCPQNGCVHLLGVDFAALFSDLSLDATFVRLKSHLVSTL